MTVFYTACLIALIVRVEIVKKASYLKYQKPALAIKGELVNISTIDHTVLCGVSRGWT